VAATDGSGNVRDGGFFIAVFTRNSGLQIALSTQKYRKKCV